MPNAYNLKDIPTDAFPLHPLPSWTQLYSQQRHFYYRVLSWPFFMYFTSSSLCRQAYVLTNRLSNYRSWREISFSSTAPQVLETSVRMNLLLVIVWWRRRTFGRVNCACWTNACREKENVANLSDHTFGKNRRSSLYIVVILLFYFAMFGCLRNKQLSMRIEWFCML